MRLSSIQTYHEIVDEGLVGEMEAKVYEYLLNNPYKTDAEITEGLGYQDPNKVRPRRKGLLDKNIVESVGMRVCKVTGRSVYQWRIREDLQKSDVTKEIKKYKFTKNQIMEIQELVREVSIGKMEPRQQGLMLRELYAKLLSK